MKEVIRAMSRGRGCRNNLQSRSKMQTHLNLPLANGQIRVLAHEARYDVGSTRNGTEKYIRFDARVHVIVGVGAKR